MRSPQPSDAELILKLYEIRRDPELRIARKWFLTDFNATSWAEIKSRYLSHSDEDRYFRMVVSYWEMVATLVNHGLIHPEVFFDHSGEHIVTWDRCKPWIAEARAALRPTYLYQFEKLVGDHLEFRKRTIAAFVASGAVNGAAPAKSAPAPKLARVAKAPRGARAKRRT